MHETSYTQGGADDTPAASAQPSGQAETSRQPVDEDRDRIAADLNDVVVRRLYSAGLSLQGALALLNGHRAHKSVQNAIAELDQAITDIRNAVFGRRRSDARGGRPPGEESQTP